MSDFGLRDLRAKGATDESFAAMQWRRNIEVSPSKLHYTDRHRLPESVERELSLTYHRNVESMVRVCDVVTSNAPLHPETEHLFNDALIGRMKRGAYLVNTARGKICDRDAIVRALDSRQLAGYGRPIRDEYLIVDRGRLAGTGAHSYSVGKTS